MKEEAYSVGDLLISLVWDADRFDLFADPALHAFSVKREPRSHPDLSFLVVPPSPTDFNGCAPIFTALPGGLWKIWESKIDGSYLLSLHRLPTSDEPYRVVLADRRFTTFRITSADSGGLFNPLEYPLAELAFSGYLNINGTGILLHAAMVSLNGRGYLFSGTSGSGKSTISELWARDSEAEVLTDERVVVRERSGVLRAYGTPWHGTGGMHRNAGAPIEKIFFIRHGSKNEEREISPPEAAKRLMVRCFPTFWHREGMEFALDFCLRIAREIECYDLGFVPDASSLAFLKERFLR